MTVNLGQLIVWVITGALAGFLAGRLFRGTGFGVVGNVVVGLLGALLGGVLVQALNIRIGGLPTFEFSLADLLIAVIGAIILLFVVRAIQRR